jgi:L-cysteine desulfidase
MAFTYTVKDILRLEVAPALGCTEPVAIALGAAAAASLLGGEEIQNIDIRVDPNIYKNGVAVAIPGTPGLCGIDLAAAIGAIGGDPLRGLEALDPVDDSVVSKAVELVKNDQVTVELLSDRKGLYIETTVKSDANTAESMIQVMHDNITALKLNGKPVEESPLLSGGKKKNGKGDVQALEAWLKELRLDQLLDLVDTLDANDLAFLEEGIQFNLRLAEHGLNNACGLGIGRTLERLARQRMLSRDMVLAARILTSAASDARMAGVKLPAMSSAGSGNHGLTATLPIHAIKDFVDCEPEAVLKAVGLSHIITAYIKSFTGRLSAVCGCSVAAGAGATAGITYLLGGNIHHIAGAIKNLTEDLAGVICDGAKAGCSLKLATAAGTAVQAALFSLQGVEVQPTDGIIGSSPEQTMQNIGTLSTQGMIETDRTILKIMLEKRFSNL